MIVAVGLCAFGGEIDVAYCDVIFHGPFPSHPPNLPPSMIRPPFPGGRPPPSYPVHPYPPQQIMRPYPYEYRQNGWGGVIEEPPFPQYEKSNPTIRRGKSCVDKICIEN